MKYNAAGDVISILLSLIIIFFIKSSIFEKSKEFKILKIANLNTIISGIFGLTYNYMILHDSNFYLIFIARCIYYISLNSFFVLFNMYLDSIIDISNDTKNNQKYLFLISWLFFAILIIISPITKFGFHINDNNIICDNYIKDPFIFSYIYFVFLIICGMIRYKLYFSNKIFTCLVEVASLSVISIIAQTIFKTSTFTLITFEFPIIIIFLLFHTNSYDYRLGTLNKFSCNTCISELKKENKDFNILFLELEDFVKKENEIFTTKKRLNIFLNKYFKDFYSFRLRDNIFCLIYKKKKGISLINFIDDFKNIYDKEIIPFKIIDIDENLSKEFKSLEDFQNFFYWNLKKMKVMEYLTITDEIVKKYIKDKKILKQLKDINNKKDLNDERIIVYCQPIMNVEKQEISSAEILMRMNLDGELVLPDNFIELAEDNGYIHTLSLIILNKACKEFYKITSENYKLNKISINFSLLELSIDSFSEELINIIKSNQIDCNKIAVELTESQQDKDFLLLEKKLKELKKQNIKLYIDDFGTGYSNLEKLLKIPVDVIKFDKSIISLLYENNNYNNLLVNLTNSLKDIGYQILFEGVETTEDEELCKTMHADFLQGYKYSKPIPFEQIRNFLSTENN